MESREGQRQLVRLSVDGRIILKIDVQEIGLRRRGFGWVDLEQDKDSWQAVVKR